MIYIIGIRRTGSTLLTQLLNRHSKIKAIPEVPIFLFFSNRYNAINKKNQLLEKQVSEYLKIIQILRPKKEVDLLTQLNFNGIDYTSYIDFMTKIFGMFNIQEKTGSKDLYVDKNPQYSLFIDEIRKYDRHAKFILLVRDPRDNILSWKNKSNSKIRNVFFNAFKYRFIHEKMNSHLNKEYVHLLKYEDLVENQEFHLTTLCKFLHVDLENAMLNNESKPIDLNIQNENLNNFSQEHLKDLSKAIHKKHMGKWKNELSEKEINVIENITYPYMQKFGYSTTLTKLNYNFLVLSHFHWYILAKWQIFKERLIYHVSPKIKLWRLKSMYRNDLGEK